MNTPPVVSVTVVWKLSLVAFLDISQLSLQKVFCLLHFTSDRTCSRWRTSSRVATPSTPSQQCTARTSIISCIPGWSSWEYIHSMITMFFIVTKYIQVLFILPIQIKSSSVGSTAEGFPVREPLMTLRGLFAFLSERSQLWHQQCCLAFHAFHTVTDSQSVSGPHIPKPHSSAAFLSILGKRAGGLWTTAVVF